jgi:gluconokinase
VDFPARCIRLFALSENGDPLSKAIIWADGRSNDQAEKLMQTEGMKIYEKTGMPIHPKSPLVKLLWMKETEYEPYQKASSFMSLKENVPMGNVVKPNQENYQIYLNVYKKYEKLANDLSTYF